MSPIDFVKVGGFKKLESPAVNELVFNGPHR